jgi:hypothetical protein
MSADRFDVRPLLTWDDGLPRPQWELIQKWIERQVGPEEQHAAWTGAAEQWLQALCEVLGTDYCTGASEHFLLLGPQPEDRVEFLLGIAERCRETLLDLLPTVADFSSPGKHVLIVLPDERTFGTYVSPYYPEGRSGRSAGAHVHEGYPHMVLRGTKVSFLEASLVHGLAHASLSHLSLPSWLEAGLSETVKRVLFGRWALCITAESARQHKRFWGRYGLDLFWYGEGFFHRGLAQNLSYELAEILLHLLLTDFQPRWFGRDRQPQERLFAFLLQANAADAGAAAARRHFDLDLGDLAARFLGPGAWSPGPAPSADPPGGQ